jgi:hypothetical protein
MLAHTAADYGEHQAAAAGGHPFQPAHDGFAVEQCLGGCVPESLMAERSFLWKEAKPRTSPPKTGKRPPNRNPALHSVFMASKPPSC